MLSFLGFIQLSNFKERNNFINIPFKIPFCLFSSSSGNIQTDCIYSLHIVMQNFLNLISIQIAFQVFFSYLNEIWTPYQYCNKVHTLLLFVMSVTYLFQFLVTALSVFFFLKNSFNCYCFLTVFSCFLRKPEH